MSDPRDIANENSVTETNAVAGKTQPTSGNNEEIQPSTPDAPAISDNAQSQPSDPPIASGNVQDQPTPNPSAATSTEQGQLPTPNPPVASGDAESQTPSSNLATGNGTGQGQPSFGDPLVMSQGSPEDKRAAVGIAINLSNAMMTASLAMITIEGAFFTFAIDKNQIGTTFWGLAISTFFAFIVSIYFGGRNIARLYNNGHKGNWEIATSYIITEQCLSGLTQKVRIEVLNGLKTLKDQKIFGKEAFLSILKNNCQVTEQDIELILENVKTVNRQKEFNYQAWFNFIGLLLFILWCLTSGSPKEDKTEGILNSIKTAVTQGSDQQKQIEQLRSKIDSQNSTIQNLQKQLDELDKHNDLSQESNNNQKPSSKNTSSVGKKNTSDSNVAKK